MKRLLLLLTVVLIAGTVAAQDWQVVRYGNIEYNPKDGFFLTPDSGWYVGDEGVVVRTTNGGLDGETVREPVAGTADWKDVEFANHLIGYACAYDGFIFKTTDGGLTWDNVGDTTNYTDDYTSISVVNENVVYVSGKKSSLLKTTNGGADWTKSTYDFQGKDLDGGIAFNDENNGVVISDGKGANTWYTHDGGDNWTPVDIIFPTGTNTKLYDVSAGGGSTIAVSGYYNNIFLSTNGGETYTRVGDSSTDYVYLASIDAVNENVLVAGGFVGHVVLSTNGGDTWSTIDIPAANTVKFVDFIDAQTGFVFAGEGQWFKTTDGGATWQNIVDWPNINLKALAATPGGKVMVGGYRGSTSLSSDYGFSWSYLGNELTGYTGWINTIAFGDENVGLVGAGKGKIYRTTDGGGTWTLLADTSTNPMLKYEKTVNALRFVDANTVFAGGSKGYIMKSTDAGLTWTLLYNEENNTVYDFWQVSSKQVLAVASSGELYVSNAAVDSFSLAKDYGTMNLRSVDFRGDNGVVVATKGYIYHTTVSKWDTLTEVYKDAAGDDILSVAFVNDNLVYAVGEKGRIFYSEDAGLNWQEDTSPVTDQLERVAFADNALWVAGYNGSVLMKNFTPPAPRTGLIINEFMASNDAAFADEHGDFDDWIEIYNSNDHAVDIGGMFVTDDLEHPTMWQIPDTEPDSTTIGPGGFLVLWADKESEEGVLHLELKLSGKGEQIGISDIFEGNTISIDSLTFGPQWADTSYGYVEDGGGDRGYFNPSTPGETNANGIVVVGITEKPNAFITDYHLAQNYPNPFNPTTKIEFTVPKAGKTTLTVYSVTGQKVAVLLNKDVQAGSVSVEWNGGNMASGVYFYELKSAHFTAVKKMLLMK